MDANTGLVLGAVVVNMAGVATLLIKASYDTARDVRHREWDVADRVSLRATVQDVKSEVVTRDDNATKKLDHIEHLTNSTMDALKAKLAVALERIERLEELLVKATAAQKGTA